jgi:hypothetical protein
MCAGRWSARSPTPQGCLEPDVKNLYAWCLHFLRLPALTRPDWNQTAGPAARVTLTE